MSLTVDTYLGLVALQKVHSRWIDHNFPEQNDNPHQPLLGLAEEVGELSHAHLKSEQKIRGDKILHTAEKIDAIGDIFIYLMSYCVANDLSMADCIKQTLEEVHARDWVKYPETGLPPKERDHGIPEPQP